MTDTRRSRTTETWDRARADYLAGDTAERVCARYDLGVSAFYKNARQNGWRRADQPDPEPLVDDDTLPDADLAATADLALRRMAASVQRGRAADALRWQRLHASLSDRLRTETARAEAYRLDAERLRIKREQEVRQRASLPLVATRADDLNARHTEMMAPTPLAPQQVQEVQCDSDTAPDPAPSNRSERRRQAKRARQRS